MKRTFAGNLFVNIAWDRNREVHRPRPRNLNAPMDITSPIPASCRPGQPKELCVRPDPTRGNIINLESSGGQIAQNWRLGIRDRFSIFNVSANYNKAITWLDATPANNYGNAIIAAGYGPDGLAEDNYNLAKDWSLLATPAHNLDTTVNAQLPLGFLTNTMNFRAGARYTITTGRNDNQDTSVNDRPLGLGRNSEVAPSSLTFNFNISKAFFFGAAPAGRGGSRSNVNVFANITNALNRPNYGAPSGVMTSPNFGRSTSAADPRQIEVGMRLQF